MAEFTPINTQEEFDARIAERLKSEKEALRANILSHVGDKDAEIEKLKKDIEGLNGQLTDLNGQLTEKTSGLSALEEKIKGYERASVKNKVAREAGLPWELADRLTGETEEEIRKDAESLRKLVGANKTPPLKSTESGGGNDKIAAAWAQVLQQMKGD